MPIVARTSAMVLYILAIALRSVPAVVAQDAPALIVHSATGPYRLVERSDWSRYDNGKYSGHVYREVRANIAPVADSRGGADYRGNFFVLEETLRDLSRSAGPVDEAVPAVFRVAPDGSLDMKDDRGFPSLRGFPAFPSQSVSVGTKWTARGFRAADPRNDGSIVVMPLIAEYEYRGVEPYKGEQVHRVFARYATRYRSSAPIASDSASRMRSSIGRKGGDPFTEASGTHEADILVRASDGLPLMIRDRMDETFKWADGATIRFKGFTLTFAEGGAPLNRGAAIADLMRSFGVDAPQLAVPGDAAVQGTALPGDAPQLAAPDDAPVQGTALPGDAAAIAAGPEPVSAPAGAFELAAIETSSGIDVQPTEEGVKLTVRDVRFVPDSDRILPEERDRLDLITGALRKAGDRTFLVEGHTAAVGKPAGELELSKLRAKRIVDELVARGIPAERFLFKGWGGTKPIDSNAAETGRARNRRVEITILE